MIIFEIPGEAVGKERPRTTKRGFTYTPAKTRDYEEFVRFKFREKYKGQPTTEAVWVSIIVWIVPAKSWSKKKKKEMIEKPPIKTPDADNIAKIILDALNDAAWKDDKQVVHLEVEKLWGFEEKVVVTIATKEDFKK